MEDKTRCTWFDACVTPNLIYVHIDGSASRAAVICARAELDAKKRETRYYDAEDGALLCVEEWGPWEEGWVGSEVEVGWGVAVNNLEAVAVYLRELRDARAERDPRRKGRPKVMWTDSHGRWLTKEDSNVR